MRPLPADRIWDRIDQSGGLLACWPWTGALSHGYGRLTVNGRSTAAHRLALALALGRPLRPGMGALHTCDNPPCCNPAHLFEGTDADNVHDMDRKGRRRIASALGVDRAVVNAQLHQLGRQHRLTIAMLDVLPASFAKYSTAGD